MPIYNIYKSLHNIKHMYNISPLDLSDYKLIKFETI